MSEDLKIEIPEVRIRAFRAINEPETCELFIQGHTRVLTDIGITKVTSSKNEWASNPDAFVIIVESLDRQSVYGGARIHVAGGAEALPIEQATSALDSSIHDLVWTYAKHGTGEICGLWNSQKLAGYGIGTPLLIRTLIAIASQLGIQSLFAFCAPYTVKPVVDCGMVLIESIGNKGTFFYPKLDLIATALVLEDVAGLRGAKQEDKDFIFNMRENPTGLKLSELKNKAISVVFDLHMQNIGNWSLAQTIAAADQIRQKNKFEVTEPNFF